MSAETQSNIQTVQVTPELITQLRQAGLTVRTSDEENAYLANFEKDRASKITSEIWNGVDRDLIALSGIEKLPNEKTHEYLKRAYNTLQESAKAAKKQAEKLESDIKDGKIESIYKEKFESTHSQLEAAKSMVSKKESEYEQRINEIHESYFKQSISRDLDETTKLVLSNVTDETDAYMIRLAMNDFFNKNVVVTKQINELMETEIIYSDRKGERYKSKETLEPLKLDEILLLDKHVVNMLNKATIKKAQTGTGSGKPNAGGKPNSTVNQISLDPNMTKARLMDVLGNQLQAGSTAQVQAYSDYSRRYREAYGKSMPES